MVTFTFTLAVALAACGSSSSDDATPASTSTTAAAEGASSTTTTPSQRAGTPTKDGLRNVRYCEVLLVRQEGGEFSAEVWNTLGENDCPREQWEALDATAIATERGATAAILNGPRYWVLDSITSNIRADAPETTFGELGMFQAAVIDFEGEVPSQDPYTERSIVRENVFGFGAGQEVYELVAADGTRYVMQSYSQIVDPSLSIDDLPTLGDRLELPAGWSYEVRTLDGPLDVTSSDGVATVIQDDLKDTYQRLPAAGDAQP
ncbi:MAG: hypothetical protein R2746_03410 [Acidimicrobiales bacterium]